MACRWIKTGFFHLHCCFFLYWLLCVLLHELFVAVCQASFRWSLHSDACVAAHNHDHHHFRHRRVCSWRQGRLSQGCQVRERSRKLPMWMQARLRRKREDVSRWGNCNWLQHTCVCVLITKIELTNLAWMMDPLWRFQFWSPIRIQIATCASEMRGNGYVMISNPHHSRIIFSSMPLQKQCKILLTDRRIHFARTYHWRSRYCYC